ncbi:MAG: hypothetical protein RMK57_13580 [Bryobacterales bacterium]|nr:hypothetical protein [Bryobacteraceae bacterium]MDW8355550.1 hypothetical protein [Bryobacterales bacterium]
MNRISHGAAAPLARGLAVATCLLAAVRGGAAELPVRQVILYKHGVGYFERAGEIPAGETARLEFKVSEMDDVLKSLTVADAAGRPVAGLRYASSEPLERQLAQFPFQLGKSQPLSILLDSLKGARIEIRFGEQAIKGAVVGARSTPAAEDHPEREWLTLLDDGGELRTVELSGATSLRFDDPGLSRLLRQYLETLQGARSTERRSLYVGAADRQPRRLTVSYVIPVPVWKSSYRLIFGDGREPVLEGWAIVDNTTSEDWNGVRLSLVSGRPISFVSRLYEPRYLARPTVELPEERPQAPMLHAGAIEERGERAAPMAALPEQLALRAPAAQVAPTEARQADIASSVIAAAGRELGELFEYPFAQPVTVRRGESALLPFLQQRIAARKLLIFTGASGVHPTHAVELTNNTGKTLDGGPITVFDAGAYAGEALMETLKRDDRRLISYAVDLGTRITTQFETGSEEVREVHLRRGLLTTRHALRETRTYTIRNLEQKAKTLVIEHPARPDFRLTGRKADETTANAYRFEIKLAPGALEKFPVVEERTYETTMAVTNLTPDVLVSFVRNQALPEAARQQLERLLHLKRSIADRDRELELVGKEIHALAEDQERIRRNLASLSGVSGQQEQVQNYARQLGALETRIGALRERQKELGQQKAALESELNSLIETMEF